jgi:hypothetical protein
MKNSNIRNYLVANQVRFRLDTLGVHIHYRKLRNSEWNLAENRFEGKLECWESKLLPYGNILF